MQPRDAHVQDHGHALYITRPRSQLLNSETCKNVLPMDDLIFISVLPLSLL